jgi:hypothetical protein
MRTCGPILAPTSRLPSDSTKPTAGSSCLSARRLSGPMHAAKRHACEGFAARLPQPLRLGTLGAPWGRRSRSSSRPNPAADSTGSTLKVRHGVPPASLGASQSTLGDCDGRRRLGQRLRSREMRTVIDPLAGAGSATRGSSPSPGAGPGLADLAHERGCIGADPLFGDQAVGDAVELVADVANAASGRGDAQELAGVSAGEGDADGYAVL